MKTEAIVPAPFERNADGIPFSSAYGDLYHPASGALDQARHVFLAGNGLPGRWRGRDRFVVLETGFGLGNNFLATWDAWRRDADACRQLHFVSIEQHPLTREDMAAVTRDASLAPLAEALIDAWPALTPNLHRLAFDGARVQLLLALGDVSAWLPELVARVDAFYLDGFAPARNPRMWEPRLFKAMARMAAPGATAATWTAARSVREGLTTAGFEVRLAPGRGGKRDNILATHAPAFTPRHPPARMSAPTPASARRALVIGAGLAGCATVAALAEHGWHCTLLDRHDAPAQEASGNPAGLFHGIVNAQDGVHARFNRAAALQAQRTIGDAVTAGRVRGELSGLLRLETSGDELAAMQHNLSRLGLPSGYVRAIGAADASHLAGVTLAHPSWFYPGAGWVAPTELARHFLDQAGDRCRFLAETRVHSLQRSGGVWQALDESGKVLAEADAIVLCNAGDALRLLGQAWPMEKVRGQISIASGDRLQATSPRIPIAGSGYVLAPGDGTLCFGATAQVGDDEPACRRADHETNLSQLASLLGRPLDVAPEALAGRVGWRWVTPDRLPIIGGVPDLAAAHAGARLDQPRFVPRVPGLFVFTGLGSRGITWCALGAQVVAAAVSGVPSPLESSLLDAVDPARFLSRESRRARSVDST